MHCHQVIFEYILLLCLPISIEKWPRIHRTLRTMLDFTNSRWCTFEEPQNYKNSITFFSWKIRKVIMFLHFASNLCKVFALASYYFNNALLLLPYVHFCSFSRHWLTIHCGSVSSFHNFSEQMNDANYTHFVLWCTFTFTLVRCALFFLFCHFL